VYFKSSAGWVGTIKVGVFISAVVNEKITKAERIADFAIAGF
jgi:hypothetical protein